MTLGRQTLFHLGGVVAEVVDLCESKKNNQRRSDQIVYKEEGGGKRRYS
jgi:hypothetical protein